MLGHAALFAFEKRRAVETGQTVLVLRKMCGDPVHDHADVVTVQAVDKIGEILRAAIAGGGRVIARDLISPGGVVRELHQRHQFDMRITHLAAVVGQHVRKVAVLRPLVGKALPGAGVHLVNAHGAVHEITLRAARHVIAVRPHIVIVVDHRGVLVPVLAPGRKGVGFQYDIAVRLRDGEFIKAAEADIIDKSRPDAALDAFHRRSRAIPAVEVAHQADRLGIGRPKKEAVKAQLRDVMAAEAEPRLLRVTGIEKINVILRDVLHELAVHTVFSFFLFPLMVLLYRFFPVSSSWRRNFTALFSFSAAGADNCFFLPFFPSKNLCMLPKSHNIAFSFSLNSINLLMLHDYAFIIP